MEMRRVEGSKTVLFVDVDGVLITQRSWIRPTRCKQHPRFDPLGAQILSAICERCETTLVWNTTHSMYADPGMNGLEAMARMEKLQRYTLSQSDGIRTGDATRYPREEGNRLKAIEQWLGTYAQEHTRWCALDDAMIDDERAIKVNGDIGITAQEYKEATRLLGHPHEPLILL